MAFQIKDFLSVVAGQINHAKSVTTKITDFAPGSVARTLMEAPAVEIEELYLQMFLGLRDAIPVATFQSFGFDKLPARRAFGYASVSASVALTADIAIPAGTKFTTDAGASYTSTVAVTWVTGQTLVRVPVQADVTGLTGNVAAGVITSCGLFQSSSGYTVGNSLIANGADAETDVEREARFADFVGALSRGTIAACKYAAGSAVVLDADGNIEQFVTRVGLTEIPGRVSLYIYSNRGVATSALLSKGQSLIDGERNDIDGTITPGYGPAGVRVDVLAMAERLVPMSIQVAMLPGYTLTSAVRQDLTDIYAAEISRVEAGKTLYLGSLVESLLSATGVSSVVPGGASNITCAPGEALIAGTLTISPL